MTTMELREYSEQLHYSSLDAKYEALFNHSRNEISNEEFKFKINADFVLKYWFLECYREINVSYRWMLPLIEKSTVPLEEADYIIYMHPYARVEDKSQEVADEIKWLAEQRKEGAEILVVGKAANAEKILDGKISNITFWLSHFAEKLGKKFEMDIKEHYLVPDLAYRFLAIWPVDGCLQKCKFCRRNYMDIPFESLSLEYIKKWLDKYKEVLPEELEHISLRAENLTEYGIDLYGKPMLHKLIELIDSYDEVKTIELPIGMALGEITDEILTALCNSKKITSIWTNIEAGTDRLLNVIGKSLNVDRARYVLSQLRKYHPDIEICTTVMIGLPTEELIDIYELANLIVETQPDRLLCNYYIDSPNNPLSQLPQMSDSLRKYHLKLLLKLLKKNRKKEIQVTHYNLKTNTRAAIRYNWRITYINDLYPTTFPMVDKVRRKI